MLEKRNSIIDFNYNPSKLKVSAYWLLIFFFVLMLMYDHDNIFL